MKDKRITWEESVVWLRAQPDQAELVRACFFDDPLIEAAERYYQSSEWREIRRFLPNSPGKALDLGAGRGISSYALARDGWDVVALEPDNSKIVGAGAIRQLAKESGLNIAVEQEWGEHLPFEDATFDVVHGRQVLHHAGDLGQLCLEAARVLKGDGVFMATREHVISKEAHLDIFLRNHPLHRFYGGEHAYLLVDYTTAISEAGISMTHILNPYDTDINLFPDTKFTLKKRIAKRISFPFPQYIPDFLLSYLGSIDATPGRLYSFIGRKIRER
jgi:SAM-dependent methyltransferase